MLSRAKWRLRKRRADFVTFVILERLRRLVADSTRFPLIIPGVLSLRANRLLDRTKLSQGDRGRDR
jgi:hypothetical protein